MALSKFVLTMPMRSSSNFSTSTCSPWNKRSMFEKPMGLLAILEEESLFPKASDQTFAAKLHENLLGKPACENFAKPSPKPDPHAHFAVVHYAACVSYNLT